MRIAIQDSWPNLPENAEKEFIQRFHIACMRLEINSKTVVTSEDIDSYDPDFVIASHEFTRKLTRYPTIGLIWSPLRFFENDAYRVKSILSYDGYVVANEKIKHWLKDLTFPCAIEKPISDDLFLPTTYRTVHSAVASGNIGSQRSTAAYVGVHWDGRRHSALFEELARRALITCYGPEASWAHLGEHYGGRLPFDGHSVMDVLASHSAVLCLHKSEHRQENTPSMRIFEACAVGALPICDDIEFARRELSDVALFVDLRLSPKKVANQVADHLEWIRSNPVLAQERANRGKRWFDENWSLESKIEKVIIPHYKKVRAAGFFEDKPNQVKYSGQISARKRYFQYYNKASGESKSVDCQVVVRTGGRDVSFLKRALESIQAANSDMVRLGAVVVDYKSRPDVAKVCRQFRQKGLPTSYIQSQDTGYRSTSLWAGLKHCTSEFVSHLDDDDTVFPNHYRQMAETLRGSSAANVCYTGVILLEEDGRFFNFPNFDGALSSVIEETRDLKFLDSFSLQRLLRFDNFIQSNAWMARRQFLQSIIGEDPEFVVVEDVYLYLLMASKGVFLFTGSPTAVWHWRSKSAENSMFSVSQSVWIDGVNRIRRRLAGLPFSVSSLPAAVLGERDETWSLAHERAPDTLTFDKEIKIERDFPNRFPCAGFHPPDENGGMWSSQPSATIFVILDSAVAELGGVLCLECAGAYSDLVAEPWIEVQADSGPRTRSTVHSWDQDINLYIEIPPSSSRTLKLNFRTSAMVNPSSLGAIDDRALGLRLKQMKVVRSEDFLPSPSTVFLSETIKMASAHQGPYYCHFSQESDNVGITISTEAVVYVGLGADFFFRKISADVPVAIPSTGSKGWILVIPKDRSALYQVNLNVAVNLEAETNWPSFRFSFGGSIGNYYAVIDSNYEHIAVNLPQIGADDLDADNVYFLLQRVNDGVHWECRPHYGASWKLFASQGREFSDRDGEIRQGDFKSIYPILLSDNFNEGTREAREFKVLDRKFFEVIVSALLMLATNEANNFSHRFLSSIADGFFGESGA